MPGRCHGVVPRRRRLTGRRADAALPSRALCVLLGLGSLPGTHAWQLLAICQSICSSGVARAPIVPLDHGDGFWAACIRRAVHVAPPFTGRTRGCWPVSPSIATASSCRLVRIQAGDTSIYILQQFVHKRRGIHKARVKIKDLKPREDRKQGSYVLVCNLQVGFYLRIKGMEPIPCRIALYSQRLGCLIYLFI